MINYNKLFKKFSNILIVSLITVIIIPSYAFTAQNNLKSKQPIKSNESIALSSTQAKLFTLLNDAKHNFLTTKNVIQKDMALQNIRNDFNIFIQENTTYTGWVGTLTGIYKPRYGELEYEVTIVIGNGVEVSGIINKQSSTFDDFSKLSIPQKLRFDAILSEHPKVVRRRDFENFFLSYKDGADYIPIGLEVVFTKIEIL